ncbi:MAG: YdcF family protein [Acidimicrobiales bacterium]
MSSAQAQDMPAADKPRAPAIRGRAHPRVPRWAWPSALVGLVLLYLVGTFVDVWLASRAEFEFGAASDDIERAAVVLGAAQYNGEPSPVLRSRLEEAARLYENGEVDLVVVTGGRQEADITTEAKTGYDFLREAGIPDDRIRLEVQGASTYESLAATSRFLRSDGVVEVVLVTDRYHAKRSTLIAREVGLEPVVSLTPQSPSFERLVQESVAVALGRIIGFRRLDQL